MPRRTSLLFVCLALACCACERDAEEGADESVVSTSKQPIEPSGEDAAGSSVAGNGSSTAHPAAQKAALKAAAARGGEPVEPPVMADAACGEETQVQLAAWLRALCLPIAVPNKLRLTRAVPPTKGEALPPKGEALPPKGEALPLDLPIRIAVQSVKPVFVDSGEPFGQSALEDALEANLERRAEAGLEGGASVLIFAAPDVSTEIVAEVIAKIADDRVGNVGFAVAGGGDALALPTQHIGLATVRAELDAIDPGDRDAELTSRLGRAAGACAGVTAPFDVYRDVLDRGECEASASKVAAAYRACECSADIIQLQSLAWAARPLANVGVVAVTHIDGGKPFEFGEFQDIWQAFLPQVVERANEPVELRANL